MGGIPWDAGFAASSAFLRRPTRAIFAGCYAYAGFADFLAGPSLPPLGIIPSNVSKL